MVDWVARMGIKRHKHFASDIISDETAESAPGGGAIAVDNTVDPPAPVTTLIAPGATISGDEATLVPGLSVDPLFDNGLRFTSVEPQSEAASLFSLFTSDNVAVFGINTAGDSDWTLDESQSAGMRWSNTVSGFFTEITYEGFRVTNPGVGSFEVVYDPFEVSYFGESGASFHLSTTGGTLNVRMIDLPTADPATVGRLWNDAGTLKVSAG